MNDMHSCLPQSEVGLAPFGTDAAAGNGGGRLGRQGCGSIRDIHEGNLMHMLFPFTRLLSDLQLISALDAKLLRLTASVQLHYSPHELN